MTPESQLPSARRQFALTGPSVPLDPLTHAVRPDIADIRLADRVFAPHYAEAVRVTVRRDAPLRAGRAPDSPVVTALQPGDAFDLLDVTGGIAWGIAVATGMVGYCDADLLGPDEAA